MTDKKYITIDVEEYRRLRYAQGELLMLKSGGVDNWGGYGESLYPIGQEGLDTVKESIDEEIEKHHIK